MPIKCLVPVSGGKDSQACVKLAVKHFGSENVRGLFCDTQFEHWKTYMHVVRIGELYGIKIDWAVNGTVLGESMRYKRFPGGGSRHCTDALKIRPTKLYCKALAEQQGGFEVWYGMRSGESADRAKRYAGKVDSELYHPHEVIPRKYPKYLGKMGVRFRLPILNWQTMDVLEFLEGDEHPFYAEGFDRVGCFPCLAAGDKHKEKAFAYDDYGQFQKKLTTVVSVVIGKSIWTSKGGAERNATCSLVCGE